MPDARKVDCRQWLGFVAFHRQLLLLPLLEAKYRDRWFLPVGHFLCSCKNWNWNYFSNKNEVCLLMTWQLSKKKASLTVKKSFLNSSFASYLSFKESWSLCERNEWLYLDFWLDPNDFSPRVKRSCQKHVTVSTLLGHVCGFIVQHWQLTPVYDKTHFRYLP